MIEQIKDLRIRYVFQGPEYYEPRKSKEEIAYAKGLSAGRNEGWNDCMAHLRACGKI